MSATSPISAPTSSARIGTDPLRRQLYSELMEVRRQIERFRDPTAEPQLDIMTQQIDLWHRTFLADLQRSSNIEGICNTYIASLQRLLRDPVIQAPLDEFALLGNDGLTYGQLSLNVYRLTTSPEYRDRPPLEPNALRRLTTAPHPVARHMVGWLQRHNSLLYSPELERTYLQLLSQQRSTDPQTRAPIREIKQQSRPPSLEERLRQMRISGEQEFARLNARLDQATLPLQAVGSQINAAAMAERASIVALQARITAQVHQGFGPLSQRITDYTHVTEEQLREIREAGQRSRREIEAMIQPLKDEIAALTQEIAELQAGIQDTSVQLTATQNAELALQQEMIKTRIAVQNMKKDSLKGILTAIAIVGVCCFATWAIGVIGKGAAVGAAKSAAVKATVTPISGGAKFAITIPF